MEVFEFLGCIWAAIDDWVRNSEGWAAWAQAVATVITIIVGLALHFHQADKAKLLEINKVNWTLFERDNLFHFMRKTLDDVVEMTSLESEQLYNEKNTILMYRIKELNAKCQQIKPNEMPTALAVFAQVELSRVIEDILNIMAILKKGNVIETYGVNSFRLIADCTLARQQISYINHDFNAAIQANKESYKKRTHNFVIGS